MKYKRQAILEKLQEIQYAWNLRPFEPWLK